MNEENVVSRIAPTPSGYLHLGNALNCMITWEFVRKHKGRLVLRIDDADATRARKAFVEDIFRSLDWLGIDWDIGPSGVDDFYAHYSQNRKKEKYFAVMEQIERTYSCECSRKAIRQAFGDGVYGGSCRYRQIPFVRGRTARRLIVDRPIEAYGAAVDLGPVMGDFVLWTRDDTPAYQLVSLVEDEEAAITHIFRGMDLTSSTVAQLYLARELGYSEFPRARVFHHELLYGPDGKKLAKSRGATSIKDIRESGKGRQYVDDILRLYLERLDHDSGAAGTGG
ncbi:MAG: glutamate--tRNA ligase family protein [Desulfopila sp.]